MAKKRSTSRAKRSPKSATRSQNPTAAASTAGTTAGTTTNAATEAAKTANDPVTGKEAAASKARSAQPQAASGVSAQKARQRVRRARQRRQNALLAGGIAALAVGLVTYQVIKVMNLPGQRFADQGNFHLTTVDDEHPPYNSDPPTSGWHMPGLAPWGAHLELVEDEYLVHNLEDGGVVIYYPMGSPEENQAAVDAVRAIAAPYRNVVIAPRQDLPNAYVFTAWRRMQRFDAIDEAAMGRFLEAYEGIDHHVPGIG